MTALPDRFNPSFFERGVPSPPTRRRPTRLAADVIHLAVDAFPSFIDVGVEVRVSCVDVVDALAFFDDARVGDMKLPLP